MFSRYSIFLALGLVATVRADEVAPTAEVDLRNALFTRTFENQSFGQDALDIYYWTNTRHLLEEPSHSESIQALDEFINRHGDQTIRDPLRRALLQRDLWQLFDWACGSFRTKDSDFLRERYGLKSRIATVMKRVALTQKEIAQLPNNLASLTADVGIADFPRGLLDGKGAWVMLGTSGGEVAAPVHVISFDGHSAFLVLLRLPGARAKTIEFLPEIPIGRFPPGMLVGLVRLMLLVDEHGNLVPTHIVESIQMRRYVDGRVQDFFEFLLDRERPPRLRAVAADERGYPFARFMNQGWDMFERKPTPSDPYHPFSQRAPVLKTCAQCHSTPGVQSLLSFSGFRGRETPPDQPTKLDSEVAKTIHWQQTRPEWLELNRLLTSPE